MTPQHTPSKPADSGKMLISILNWNGIDDTLRCLGGFAHHGSPRITIAVLDNGSQEDPCERLKARFPAVECHRSDHNLGFTGGHNHMIRLAMARGFDTVFILNNDCDISLESVLALQRAMDASPDLAALSCLIYRSGKDRRPLMVAGHIDWAKHRSVRPSDPDTPVPPGAPLLLVGTALLLRCKAIEAIGLLDDRYFAYYDDNDLSARLHAAGMKAAYCHESICLHDYKGPHEHSAMALYLSSRNQWLFWREHTPAAHRAGMTRHLIAESLDLIARLQHHGANTDKIDAVVAGFWDGLRGHYGPPPDRRRAPWLLRKLAATAPYLLAQLLTEPGATIMAKLRLHPRA